ncbi:hypothetical protein IX317_000934 [Fusobacterium sp. DD29]|nr:hypothetical protein [Fusobacterium sp. DD45]MBR8710146.1 hypothetical protein [Fusobacterium sp. DD28]MBR8749270.1 hypothetical protein [Fusobacterium sp. DD29]MBR8750861.1 hypothetical protein [Fusobacterium sp. DD26]MBR8761520.1 hypothetical protein [Fusobacterium sp. DD25]MBR8767533.1 hypothetical protein [Fusobacterium sp. DD43]MBR8771583.1 hypothetical protein [Fusobacterium sp. DD40]MBR8775825.1 hypothetical protein [Fusobacterium sp. DD17]MBR8798071.1 hypothetical protein [Fusoba
MVLIEILISITIFFIALYPLLNFNNRLLSINNSITLFERENKNFLALKTQLENLDNRYLKKFIGSETFNNRDGNITKENIFKDIIFPYPVSNVTITIDISPITISSTVKKYDYLYMKIMYMVNNKTFISSSLISNKEEI